MEIILFSILLGTLSMLGYGLANAFSKPLAQKLGAPQMLFLRGFTIMVLMTIASWSSFHLLANHWLAAALTIALGVAGYLPVLAFTHGIKESPLGIIAPIAGTSSLITVFLAFLFLGTVLNPGQWIAILAVVIANIAISIDIRNWRDSNILKRSSGIPYAVAAAIGWGLFFFFFVPVSKTLGPWLATLLAEIGVTIAAGVHTFQSQRKVSVHLALRPGVMLNGFLICVGTSAFAIGVSRFNVAIVAALSNSTALLATLFGLWLYREHLGRKEALAGAVMIACVAAMSFL